MLCGADGMRGEGVGGGESLEEGDGARAGDVFLWYFVVLIMGKWNSW